jgi:hypothetical protein
VAKSGFEDKDLERQEGRVEYTRLWKLREEGLKKMKG